MDRSYSKASAVKKGCISSTIKGCELDFIQEPLASFHSTKIPTALCCLVCPTQAPCRMYSNEPPSSKMALKTLEERLQKNPCHSECARGCYGSDDTQCVSCLHKSFRGRCVPTCPPNTYLVIVWWLRISSAFTSFPLNFRSFFV